MDDRSRRMAKRFDAPLMVAAVLIIPVIVIQESAVGEPLKTIGAVLNWAIWIAFAAEIAVMVAVVPRKVEWLRRHPLEVAVVVFTPPFLPTSLQAARALRLLRLLRLMRVVQIYRRVFTPEGLRYVAVLALITVLGLGAAFHAVERKNSVWDGVYWAATTMTTVGSDINPATTTGRVFALILMIVGLVFAAVFTGFVAERFFATRKGPRPPSQDELLGHVQDITARLHALETALLRGPVEEQGGTQA